MSVATAFALNALKNTRTAVVAHRKSVADRTLGMVSVVPEGMTVRSRKDLEEVQRISSNLGEAIGTLKGLDLAIEFIDATIKGITG